MNNTRNSLNITYLSIIQGIYVVLIGIGLPIIVRDSYFDILLTKYYFYWISTVIMIVLSVIYFIAKKDKNIFDKGVRNQIFVQDYAVLLFFLVAIMSTLSSSYRYESFWGNEGRYTGLFLLGLYVLSYFLVSRFLVYRNFYIDAILATGMFVCVFGITDFFQMDILNFKKNVITNQLNIFTSTIGNINAYTSYVAMIMAISTVLFATAKETKKMVLYYLCMVVSFFAMIMGVSDNAYISIAALFLSLPLYLFSKKRGVQRFLIILATFFSVIQITAWINISFGDNVVGIDSLFNYIANSGVLPYFIGVLICLIVFLNFIESKIDLKCRRVVSWKKGIWLVLICLTTLLIVYILYDCNVLGNVKRYGSFGTYLLFNDEWGTHRGYIWRKAIEQFTEYSLWKKMVGFGPDTFGILLMNKTYGNPYNEVFDAAHNEYLQFLLTVGIVGVTSYVVFIIAYITRCFSCVNKNPYMIAMVFGVICYSAQAFVNLSVPVVTPFFWLLLGMGSSISMKDNKNTIN